MVWSHWKQWTVSYRTKCTLTTRSSDHASWYAYPKGAENPAHTEILHWYGHQLLLTAFESWKQSRCPSVNGWIINDSTSRICSMTQRAQILCSWQLERGGVEIPEGGDIRLSMADSCDIWQKPIKYCKIPQFKNKLKINKYSASGQWNMTQD